MERNKYNVRLLNILYDFSYLYILFKMYILKYQLKISSYSICINLKTRRNHILMSHFNQPS